MLLVAAEEGPHGAEDVGRLTWSGRAAGTFIGEGNWRHIEVREVRASELPEHLPLARGAHAVVFSPTGRVPWLNRALALRSWFPTSKAEAPLAWEASSPIEPTVDQITLLQQVDLQRPVVMVNYLAFREEADASHEPAAAGMSGADAYARYGNNAAPLLASLGARLAFMGPARATLGESTTWHQMVGVSWPRADGLAALSARRSYQRGLSWRRAGLASTRLLVVVPDQM